MLFLHPTSLFPFVPATRTSSGLEEKNSVAAAAT